MQKGRSTLMVDLPFLLDAKAQRFNGRTGMNTRIAA